MIPLRIAYRTGRRESQSRASATRSLDGFPRANTDAEDRGHFLVAFSFSQQLHNLPLSRAEPLGGGFQIGLCLDRQPTREQYFRNSIAKKTACAG